MNAKDIMHDAWANNQRLHHRDPETGRVWWISCSAPVRKYDPAHGYCIRYEIRYHRDRETRMLELFELEGERGLPTESGSLYESEPAIRRDLAYLFGSDENVPPYELIFDLIRRASGFSMPDHWS
jgi:hypothetical protein